jgi:hypothetical protein
MQEDIPMIRRILVLIAAFAVAPAGAELYKWTDADGRIHYTDTPPPANARRAEKKKLTDKPSAPTLPYSLQQAMKNFPVTLFSYDCGEGCKRAAALLAKRGIPHTAKDPLDPPVREELKKATGGDEAAPVLVVGKWVLKGFEEGAWNGALDAAGYPSTPIAPLPPVEKPKPAGEAAAPAADPEQPAPEN